MRRTRVQKRVAARNADPRTLNDLVPDPKNARRHTERNRAMIAESLETVGAARSIVIDEGSRVLAGNATHEQALAKGLKLKVVDVDGQTVVAVRRRNLTPEQKTALALYDNRAAELGEWDPDVLRELVAQGQPLPMFHEAELSILLEAFAAEEEPELDEAVATGVKMATCPGCGQRFPL